MGRRNHMMMVKEKKSRGGFTLVEVIVVCVILALLASIAVPAFAGYIDKKKADECRINRKSLLLMYSGEKVKNPSVTMDDVLHSPEGSAVRCPSGGTYSSEGDRLKCSIPEHGEEIVTAENIPADKIPGREEPPAVITPSPTAEVSPTDTPAVTDTPAETPKPTDTEAPIVSPTVTSVPTDTPTPKPTDTEKPAPTIVPEKELEEMSGSWEAYVKWVVENKKEQGAQRGTIFAETKGNKKKYGVYVDYGPQDVSDIKHLNKPMESKHDIIMVDPSVVFLEKNFETMQESFKEGDLYYDGKKYYVYVGQDSSKYDPAKRPPNYRWVEIMAFDETILNKK